MKLLRHLLAYVSRRSLLPRQPLSCVEQKLEQLRHQADSFSRGHWL